MTAGTISIFEVEKSYNIGLDRLRSISLNYISIGYPDIIGTISQNLLVSAMVVGDEILDICLPDADAEDFEDL